ncbi:hypothetical protein T190607A02C_20230 [Tenacibaculum sp. 190524A02b]
MALLLFPTLVLTISGSKDISQTSYLATPKVYVANIIFYLRCAIEMVFYLIVSMIVKGLIFR